jgi:hypothetical protein
MPTGLKIKQQSHITDRMALSPLTREQLQQLYDGSEAVRQKLVQETIHHIYTSVVAYATKVSTMSYTYQLSKYVSTPQNNDEIVAGLKLVFPDSSITLVDQQHSNVIVIDWSSKSEQHSDLDE